MSGLNRPTLRIDQPRDPVGGASVLATGGALASPAIPLPAAPSSLTVVSTALARSAVTPTAIANLRWLPPQGIPVGGYILQWATDAGFTTPTRLDVAGDKVDAAVPNLPCGVLIFFRIATVAPAGLVGPFGAPISQATPSDTTPPAAPGSPAAAFLADGSLRVSWAKPSSANFRAVELRIFNAASKAVEYEVVGEADGTLYVWPASRNRQQSAGSPDGSPDPSVYVELRSLSWGGVYSAAVSATATKARPANISGVSVDFTGRDAVFSCASISDAVAYLWTIDGQLYETSYPTFTYRLEENILRHGGTPVASLPYSIRARDALDQTSLAATTGTATNAAPAATTIAATGAFFTVSLTITPSAATDLRDYRVRAYRNSTLVRTFFTTQTQIAYQVEDGDGSYTFDVTVYDLFGQASPASAQSVAAAVRDYAAFATLLREEAIYSDSQNRSSAALKAALADEITSVGGNGLNYGGTAAWEWVQIYRELAYRYKPMTIGRFAMASGTGTFYVQTSTDGSTWRYFSGPPTIANGVGVLAEVASEAQAQSAAVTVSNATTLVRWELPVQIEARYVRLGIRQPTVALTLREFYADTYIRVDRIQAGAIETLHLAAAAVTADKTSIGQLSAITADMGNLTAGTVTGATVRSAASGARWEGNSTRLFGTDGTNTQWEVLNTNGKFTAGAGNISIGRDGIVINTPVGGAVAASNEVRFTFDGVEIGKLAAGGSFLGAGTGILASGATNAFLQAVNGGDQTTLAVGATGVSVSGYGLNVGAASGAGTGQIKSIVEDSATTTASTVMELGHRSTGTPGNSFGGSLLLTLESSTTLDQLAAAMVWRWANATHGARQGRGELYAYDTAGGREALRWQASGSAAQIGFLGAAAIARQTAAAAATDLASVITLANDMRAKLISFGLFQ